MEIIVKIIKGVMGFPVAMIVLLSLSVASCSDITVKPSSPLEHGSNGGGRRS